MSIQVGSGLTPSDQPETVPDAVEMICKHSEENEARREFAYGLIRGNIVLYHAITAALIKETGRYHTLDVYDVDSAIVALLRWCHFADSIGQFKLKERL